jgi:hypothetical protein
MPPQALALALFIIEEGIKLEPAIAAEIQSLLAKPDPGPEDWALLRSKVASKKYEDYVPESALVAPPVAAAVPIKVLPAPVAAPQADKPDDKAAPAAGIAVATEAAFSL